MPTRLTGLDAAFLYLETPTSHMHVGGVVVLDPSTAPGGRLTRDDMAAFVGRRLHLAPPFRRRLAWVPFNLDHPQWIEDPDFNLDFHVRRAALPAPGGIEELAEFVGDVMGRPLDKSRPLWELWVVEGLEAGRVAVVTKTHHAAIDGVSGAELAAALLQLTPDQEPDPPVAEWSPERPPGDAELLVRAGLHVAASPMAWWRTGRRAVESAAALLRFNFHPQQELPPAPFAAPMTPLNGSIGPRRIVALGQMELLRLKEVKNRLGGTVNDVILAAVAGALRTFLRARGAPPDRPLVAMVPISVRAETQRNALGNQVSAMLVGLPVDAAEPVARLRRVSDATAAAKEQHGALGASTIQQFAEVAPGGVSSLAARLYTRFRAADRHRPIWNTVVSNVPGPRFPLYCAGARMEAFYPIGPIHEMVGLNVTLFSYLDEIFVGLNADPELLPDVADIRDALLEAVDELEKAAHAQGKKSR